MLASSATGNETLSMSGYAYERKLDGMRITAVIGDTVELWSRDGNNKTRQFPDVVAALRAANLPHGTVPDGEVLSIDAKGNIEPFQTLSESIHLHRPNGGRHTFAMFDLLSLGDTNLRNKPLSERRAVLEDVLAHCAKTQALRLTLHTTDGWAMYRQAVKERWEGLIAKRLSSAYHEGGRGAEWVKLKFTNRQEFVVLGMVEGEREPFGSLALGVYEAGQLYYVGNVGSFEGKNVEWLLRAIVAKLVVSAKPALSAFDETRMVVWCKPMVAEIEFQEWTQDGKLRHPVWVGFRDDKQPCECVREG